MTTGGGRSGSSEASIAQATSTSWASKYQGYGRTSNHFAQAGDRPSVLPSTNASPYTSASVPSFSAATTAISSTLGRISWEGWANWTSRLSALVVSV
jgi:hypothetical protein